MTKEKEDLNPPLPFHFPKCHEKGREEETPESTFSPIMPGNGIELLLQFYTRPIKPGELSAGCIGNGEGGSNILPIYTFGGERKKKEEKVEKGRKEKVSLLRVWPTFFSFASTAKDV